MSDYQLKDFARFLEYQGGIKYGLQIACPNCGREYSALFKNPIGAAEPIDKGNRPHWDRTGDTLEAMSLNPSFLAFDCYHSWIRDGKLSIDSPFRCTSVK